MDIDFSLFDSKPNIDEILLPLPDGSFRSLDVLRLDAIHPTISGNKWYKLKYNLVQAQSERAKQIVSFGGAYSNHLHALAYAGFLFDFKTVGILRGSIQDNPSLQDCLAWGMELIPMSREAYRTKHEPVVLEALKIKHRDSYIIPEGGDNELGRKGCQEILSMEDVRKYDTVACAIGTATTFRGLLQSYSGRLLGFSALKNGTYLEEPIRKVQTGNWKIYHDYHFGGFAKKNEQLLDFMLRFRNQNGIELDFIYNAKMFYGLAQEIFQGRLVDEKNILAIHSGGLQGNRSLNTNF